MRRKLKAISIKKNTKERETSLKTPVKENPHLTDVRVLKISGTTVISYVLHEVAYVFFIVFISSVIQITLVFSIFLFLLFKIITDTVWFQVTLRRTEILIDDVDCSYHVILQSVAIAGSTDESQIATMT